MKQCTLCSEPAKKLHTIAISSDVVEACVNCIGHLETEFMDKHGQATLYLYTKGEGNNRIPSHVSNWLNELPQFPVVRWSTGKHNICGTRTDVWFKHNGYLWWGLHLGDNDVVHCKRTKEKVST